MAQEKVTVAGQVFTFTGNPSGQNYGAFYARLIATRVCAGSVNYILQKGLDWPITKEDAETLKKAAAARAAEVPAVCAGQPERPELRTAGRGGLIAGAVAAESARLALVTDQPEPGIVEYLDYLNEDDDAIPPQEPPEIAKKPAPVKPAPQTAPQLVSPPPDKGSEYAPAISISSRAVKKSAKEKPKKAPVADPNQGSMF